MDPVSYVPASQLDLPDLVRAFNHAFTGYYLPLTQTVPTLQAMVRANDIRLEDSRVALDGAGEPVGVALLGLRAPRGWVGGMGIAPERRRQGYGAALMRELIAHCRALGLETLNLEVLEQNTPARNLYSALGFADLHALQVFTGPLATPGGDPPSLPPGHTIHPVEVSDALARFAALHAVAPPWQRDLPSLRHAAAQLSALGLYRGEALAAYVLYGAGSGGLSIQDAGSDAAERGERASAIEALIRSVVSGSPTVTVRAVNVPPGDALGDALATLGCPVVLRQREMAFDLRDNA